MPTEIRSTQLNTLQLEADETAAFGILSSLCAERGLLKRPDGLSEGDVCDGLTDDITILRFLKARRLTPHDAVAQFEEANRFRNRNQSHLLYENILVDDFEDTRKLYPHWTGRRDRRGLPILMFEMTALDDAALEHWRETRDMQWFKNASDARTNGPSMSQRASVYHDSLTRFVLPLCSAAPDRPSRLKPVSNSIYIVDASSFSLKQAWNLRDFAQGISSILDTCYPETIDRIFVCNVPSYFSTIWGALQKFVDPRTAAKIMVLKSADVYPTLEKYVEKENIPTQCGGDFAFRTGMLPDLDSGLRQSLTWVPPCCSLPSGPIKFIEYGEGRRKAIATGILNGEQRAYEVAILNA